MSYLDEYDSPRPVFDRLVRLIAVAMIAAIVGYSVYWLFFRNWREERQVKLFLEEVKQQRYEAAYERWGCSVAEPCRFYTYESFPEGQRCHRPRLDQRPGAAQSVGGKRHPGDQLLPVLDPPPSSQNLVDHPAVYVG